EFRLFVAPFLRGSPMRPLAFVFLLLPLSSAPAAAPVAVEKGSFRFRPADAQKDVPPRYRLTERSCSYEMEKKRDLPAIGVTVYRLRYPSPVKTPTLENNTVHA